MMHMTFYWSKNATILFDGWITKTWLGYILSLAALFLAALFNEYVVSRRILLIQASKSPGGLRKPLMGDCTEPPPSSIDGRAVESILFVVNSALGLLLMLAAMSFNGGVFVSIVVGLGVGYFVFRSGDRIGSGAAGREAKIREEACDTSCCT
ncbi:hypothetical protein SELMODRAFT_123191 [Selaginella moellendorffii]|uniref:Copper transport protein n=1 Tax=Selaginella moellendorffii TaxID=88036 RepID=D8SR15_SELML|nr:copper transporter 5.1 [Selaginella moellendorffii]EFJ13071.1 hypothetical protein SELMODRAFT_123191 [Selaginella moellendorffii]|eukprot:XP_002985894.1 copper transporter 5.1 [Selaginella moellendorffii]